MKTDENKIYPRTHERLCIQLTNSHHNQYGVQVASGAACMKPTAGRAWAAPVIVGAGRSPSSFAPMQLAKMHTYMGS
jgi:hypothetical protein